MTFWTEALAATIWVLGMPTAWVVMDPDTSDAWETCISMALTWVWPLTVLVSLVIHTWRVLTRG